MIKRKHIKLKEAFECDGHIYVIARAETASEDTNLGHGLILFELTEFE